MNGITDIEYRITQVEKLASRDEEKVKQELYDALKDKRIIIEDLKEQLAFRNSALENEISLRLKLDDERKHLVRRLEEALCSTPTTIYTNEGTQTPKTSIQNRGVQTDVERRIHTRAEYTQTWDILPPPPIITPTKSTLKSEQLASQIRKLQDHITEMRKEQNVIERDYQKKLTDLKIDNARVVDSMNSAHFQQEKLLGDTILKLKQENENLHSELAYMKQRSQYISDKESDSDEFNRSAFCCAPAVRRKKKKKKGRKGGGEQNTDTLPNPYGLHTSDKHSGTFWNGQSSQI